MDNKPRNLRIGTAFATMLLIVTMLPGMQADTANPLGSGPVGDSLVDSARHYLGDDNGSGNPVPALLPTPWLNSAPESPLPTWPAPTEPEPSPLHLPDHWVFLYFMDPQPDPVILSPLDWEVSLFHLHIDLTGKVTPGDVVILSMLVDSVPILKQEMKINAHVGDQTVFWNVPANIGADYLVQISNVDYPFDPFSATPHDKLPPVKEPCESDLWETCELVRYLLDCAEDSACIQVNPCEDAPAVCAGLFLVMACLEDPNCLTPPDPCELASDVCNPPPPCTLLPPVPSTCGHPPLNHCDYAGGLPGLCGNPVPCQEHLPPIQESTQQSSNDGDCPVTGDPCQDLDLVEVPGTCEHPLPDPCGMVLMICVLIQFVLECINDPNCPDPGDPCDYLDGVQIPGACGHPLPCLKVECLPDYCDHIEGVPGTCGYPLPCTGTECLPPIDPCLIAPTLACALIESLRECFTKSKCPIGDVEPCKQDPCYEVPDICDIIVCTTQSSLQCAYWPMGECPGMDDPLMRFIHELASPLYPEAPENWTIETIFIDDLQGLSSVTQASASSSGVEVARYSGLIESYGGPGDVGTLINFHNIQASGSVQVALSYCYYGQTNNDVAVIGAAIDGITWVNLAFRAPSTGSNTGGGLWGPCTEGNTGTFYKSTFGIHEPVPITSNLRLDFKNGDGRIGIADIVVTAASGGSSGGGSNGGGTGGGGGSSGGGGGAVPNRDPHSAELTSGTHFGYTGVAYTFKARAYDPDGNRLTYEFDRGDGTPTVKTPNDYSQGSQASIKLPWQQPGDYYLKVRAHDGRGGVSDWSAPHHVVIYPLSGDCSIVTDFQWKPGYVHHYEVGHRLEAVEVGGNTVPDWGTLGEGAWAYHWNYHPSCAPNIQRVSEPGVSFAFTGKNWVHGQESLRFGATMIGEEQTPGGTPIHHKTTLYGLESFFRVPTNRPEVIPHQPGYIGYDTQHPISQLEWICDEWNDRPKLAIAVATDVFGSKIPATATISEVADYFCVVEDYEEMFWYGGNGWGLRDKSLYAIKNDEKLEASFPVDYSNVPGGATWQGEFIGAVKHHFQANTCFNCYEPGYAESNTYHRVIKPYMETLNLQGTTPP